MSIRSAAAGGHHLRYDGVQITLHWLTAVLVVTLFLLAQLWGLTRRGSPLYQELVALHVSLGLTLAGIVLVRLAWRAGPGRRLPPAASGLAERAAQAAHYGLYALLVATVGFGVLWRWGLHHSVSLFGWYTIPSPYAFTRTEAYLFGDLHSLAATCVILLAGLHACAALFHHYMLRDDVLRRMLPFPPARPPRTPRARLGAFIREAGDRSG